jgi:hypothetical protein
MTFSIHKQAGKQLKKVPTSLNKKVGTMLSEQAIPCADAPKQSCTPLGLLNEII